jgi:putative restriction endonuclease
MRAYVGVTDFGWFNLLRNIPNLDEVNFWQPGGNRVFSSLKPGEFFLFKLHSPNDYIVGGGVFASSRILPINFVWDAFGIKNGTNSLMEMRKHVGRYRHQQEDLISNYNIGCIILEQPFFLPQSQWVPVPDWKSPIVQGKSYNLEVEPGLSLWKQLHLSTLLASAMQDEKMSSGVEEEQARYGSPATILPRLGQGSFRVLVTEAYNRRCAITNERTLPALEAAHIKPYSESGRNIIKNGILLRKDIHALFDEGYVTINKSMKFEVSHRIKDEYENGKEYYRLHGSTVRLPDNPADCPSLKYIEWHNNFRFKE